MSLYSWKSVAAELGMAVAVAAMRGRRVQVPGAILRPATICAPSRFLHCVELEVVNVFDIATKKNRILLYLLFAKCHILGHQFSVVQLICFYLLVNSKGNSRSKLWQTQQQGGGEEILSHENGCASAASMRSRNMLMEQRWAWLLRELHARQVQTELAVARVLLKTVFLKNFHCFWFKTQILRNYLPLVKTQNKNLVNNNLD